MGECSSQKAEKSRIAKIKNEASKEPEAKNEASKEQEAKIKNEASKDQEAKNRLVEHLVRSSNHNMQREEAINFADGTEIRSDVHEPA